MVKQISVFVENKKGRLARITETLAQSGIDLIALSIADTANFGIMRCIVSETDKAISLLKQNGFTASVTDVLVAEVEDKPGGLSSVLKLLDDAGISIEYLYSSVRTPNKNAVIIFRVEDIKTAAEVLEKNSIVILDENKIRNI
jgi:hypothetical protein